MDGKCPKCDKVYGDGEASLSADLKPACPVCLVDLVFLESGKKEIGVDDSTQDDDFDEWKLAASRWAEGGFKSSEMPDFIKTEDESETETEDQESNARKEENIESFQEQDSVPTEDAFSGSTIPEKENQDKETKEIAFDSDSNRKTEDDQQESKQIKIEIKHKEDLPYAKSKSELRDNSEAGKSKFIKRLAIGLVLLSLVVFGVFWLLLDDEINKNQNFSLEGLRVMQIRAPQPEKYNAKHEALLHYGQGNQFAYVRKWERAILEYKESLRLDPKYPHPYRALGAVYAAMGKSEESIRAYEAYLEISTSIRDAAQIRRIIESQSND